MIRGVADTNIFISAFIYGGVPAEFLDRAFQNEFLLITSTALLYELDGKLRTKLHSLQQRQTRLAPYLKNFVR